MWWYYYIIIWNGLVLHEMELSRKCYCGLLSYLVMWVSFRTVVHLIANNQQLISNPVLRICSCDIAQIPACWGTQGQDLPAVTCHLLGYFSYCRCSTILFLGIRLLDVTWECSRMMAAFPAAKQECFLHVPARAADWVKNTLQIPRFASWHVFPMKEHLRLLDKLQHRAQSVENSLQHTRPWHSCAVVGRSGGMAWLHWGHSRIPPQFPDQIKAPELGKPLFINQMSIKLKQRILHEISGSRFCTVFARTMAYYDILALDLWLWGSVLQSSQSAAHALLLTGRHWWS